MLIEYDNNSSKMHFEIKLLISDTLFRSICNVIIRLQLFSPALRLYIISNREWEAIMLVIDYFLAYFSSLNDLDKIET